MKIKLFTFITVTLLLFGCSADSAKELGKGISIEFSNSTNIKHLTLFMYVDGIEVFSEHMIHANQSAFEKGDIIWFDVSPASANSTVELALSYSENINGSNSKTTPKLDISNANKWVNVSFSSNYQLKLIEMD